MKKLHATLVSIFMLLVMGTASAGDATTKDAMSNTSVPRKQTEGHMAKDAKDNHMNRGTMDKQGTRGAMAKDAMHKDVMSNTK